MRSKPMFGTLLLLTALSGCPSGEPQTGSSGKLTGEVRATTIGEIPLSDPLSLAWNGTPETSVMLLPQTVAYPNLIKQSVKELRVRALADAQFLAVRLEWNDPSLDEKLEVDKFTDGVAVEVPLGDPDKTNPMMGDPANPVFILHWKAAWQRDVDRGRADVQDYHPGFISDRPPFVSGGHPYPISEAFETDNARRYLPGTAAGNPVSKIFRKWPVEELQAEGFGSLADHTYQDSQGKGVWKDGKWTVVLALPRQSPDRANPMFVPGKAVMGFAVWDGANQNVGGRKHWAPFVKVVLP
ncbi:MAG: hypothetical protein JNM83_13585 [Myxococcales bacterium]|nr:hypothetical protein [Myxococcales bacterium]